MICRDIHEHMKAQGTWVKWDATADTFKAGDPDKPVRKVAVAWKARWDTLRQALERGADLFVSHESICVCASNNSTEPEVTFALPTEKPKFDWLAASGLTVYRCHDVWDRFPGLGIRDTWQRELQLGGRVIREDGGFLVTQFAPMPLKGFARHVARRIAPLGQNAVGVCGDMEQMVSKVATGTGVSCDPIRMMELGADVGILTDDYYAHVRTGAHALELKFPTITVNHGVSEEWGVANLAQYLAGTFPQLEVFHIPQPCAYTIVGE